jgi:hypothetical protein
MKEISLKNFILIICLSFFSINLFAQGPADPGNDPLVASDITNETTNIPLNTTAAKKEIPQFSLFHQTSLRSSITAITNESKIHFSHFYQIKHLIFLKSKTIGDLALKKDESSKK